MPVEVGVLGTVMSEKGVRVKRKYGMFRDLKNFSQLRTRARQEIIRKVLAAAGMIVGSVALAFLFKAAALRFGF